MVKKDACEIAVLICYLGLVYKVADDRIVIDWPTSCGTSLFIGDRLNSLPLGSLPTLLPNACGIPLRFQNRLVQHQIPSQAE